MITYHIYDEFNQKLKIDEKYIQQYPIIKIIEEFLNNIDINYNIKINYGPDINFNCPDVLTRTQQSRLLNIIIYPYSTYEKNKLYITPQSETKFNISYIIYGDLSDMIIEYNNPKFIELIFNALKEYHLYVNCLISSISTNADFSIQENFDYSPL